MAEEEVKCPLCDRKCKSSKALVKHLKDNHKDAPDLLDLTKSVPKSPPQPCRFCGRPRTNLWQHEHIVKPELLKLLQWFCDNQKECAPFERCSREQVSQNLSSQFHH